MVKIILSKKLNKSNYISTLAYCIILLFFILIKIINYFFIMKIAYLSDKYSLLLRNHLSRQKLKISFIL